MNRSILFVVLLLTLVQLSVSITPFRHPKLYKSSLNFLLEKYNELYDPIPTPENNPTNAPLSEPQIYTYQILDHFSSGQPVFWNQTYYVNTDCKSTTNPNPPVFLVIGGEGPLSNGYVDGGFYINTQACQYGGIIVALEHRFYGSSLPTGSDASPNSLRYLTSQQALADTVTFKHWFNQMYNTTNSKWIVLGGSYSGNLAAWARLLYPNEYIGALSVSGPVQAVIDFSAYQAVVGQSLGADCANAISNATAEIDYLLSSPQGQQQLFQQLPACNPIQASADYVVYMESLTYPIDSAVQYNLEGTTAFLPYCVTILNGSTPYNGYVAWAQQINAGGCIGDSYSAEVAGYAGMSDARSWLWQTCTEFGYFQASEAGSPFSPWITAQSYLQLCADVFGVEYSKPNITGTNAVFGGWNIQTSNTVFSHGDVDPWSALRVQMPVNMPGSFGKLLHGTAHCADMMRAAPGDLPDLQVMRDAQTKYIGQWLAQSKDIPIDAVESM